MIKEIKYNGFSASPGDHEALEGDLCVAMNLIPEHNTIRPVLPPKVIAQIPGDTNLPIDKGRKIVCIHQTSAFKHFIVAIEFDGLSPQHPPYTYLYRWDGTEGSGLVRLGYKAFNEVYKVEPVGNTLVVLTDTGIHYYLWKSGAYQYLGTHLPEVDIEFMASKYSAPWSMVPDDDDDSWENTDNPDRAGMQKIILPVNEGARVYRYQIEDDVEGVRTLIENTVMAAANAKYGYNCEHKRFSFPFFVRYALKLYDESITMHSAPFLVMLPLEPPTIWANWNPVNSSELEVHDADGLRIYAVLDGYELEYRPLDREQIEQLKDWKDIVTGIEFYISPQFFTYDQAAGPDDITVAVHPKIGRNNNVKKEITENGAFHLLCEIPSSRIETPIIGGAYSFEKLSIDFPTNNDIIRTRSIMTDDYQSHDYLQPSNKSRSFAFNNRLNVANLSRMLFSGFTPCCFFRETAEYDPFAEYHGTTNREGRFVNNVQCTVVVEEEGREIIVQSTKCTMYLYEENEILWVYYPNINAKRAFFDINGDIYELKLRQHATLNGAYFCSLDDDAEQQRVDSIPTPSTPEDRLVDMPNKVYTSEVDNPFYFPKLGINSIGTGNVLGICAAVRPVSTGQMGYADLYIFADSGIWTAKINKEGTYSDVTLASGDICINPDSITQMETSVLFTTDRGIMLISGSQAQCISEAIDDDGQPFTLQHPAVDDMATMLGLDVGISPFKDFVRECRMVYDYTGQRIIVFNPGYNYAYIYSLESNKWGMMQCNIDYSVRAYPAALAVTRDGELVNCSVGDSSAAVTQMLITRPLSLDLPDVQKTVRAVLQRGLFIKRRGHVRSILFASRDMLDWFSMMSSKDEDMRGFSGTGFKWFRVGLLLQLEPHESIQGCSIQYDTKYTNRLR